MKKVMSRWRPNGTTSLPPDGLLWAVAGVMLFLVWPIHLAFPGFTVLRPGIAAVAVAVLLWGFSSERVRSIGTLDHPVLRWLCALAVLGAASIPLSVYRRASFDFLFNTLLFSLTTTITVAAAIRSLRDLDWILKAFVIAGAAFTSYSLLLDGGGDRLSGAAYYDANDLATVLVCALPMAVGLVRDENRLWRFLGVLFSALFLYAHVRTGSRGGFLGLVAVGVYFLVRARGFSTRVKAAVLAGAFVLALSAGTAYWDRMRTILSPEQDYNYSGRAAAGRMEIWKRGIHYMVSGPLGVGLNAFSAAEGRSETAVAFQSRGIGFKWSAPHNSFIQVGAELGLPGLFCFLMAFYLAFRTLRAISTGAETPGPLHSLARRLAGTLTVSLVGFVAAGSFVSFGYSALLYFLFGAAVALFKLERLGALAPQGASQPALPMATQDPWPSGQRGRLPLRDQPMPAGELRFPSPRPNPSADDEGRLVAGQ